MRYICAMHIYAYMRDKIAENIMKLTINYKKVSFDAHFKILGIGTGVTSAKDSN